MNANEAYLLARAYTNKALEGAGALKGAPCQIKSITSITGGHRVTFEWEDSEGETSTETMDVMDGTNGTDGDDGVGISSITYKEEDQDGNYVYTVLLTDSSSYDITCPKGPQGATGATGADGADGADGNGIASITKTGTSGLVDTYTITYTDGTTSTFTVTNGQTPTVDSAMSDSSTNPVQNKVVKEALDAKQNALTAGDYVVIENNKISVSKLKQGKLDLYSYEFVTTDASHTPKVKVIKKVNGETISETVYDEFQAANWMTFDDIIRFRYDASDSYKWKYQCLVTSNEHVKDTVISWFWNQTVDYTETFDVGSSAITDLVTKGDMTNALETKADTDMVAADFNAGTSYTAGNYCVQDGKLYKFKNNHSGAWSAADVDEVKIAGELAAKQPKTDNNLTTTSKDTTGAINELKSGLNDLGSVITPTVGTNITLLNGGYTVIGNMVCVNLYISTAEVIPVNTLIATIVPPAISDTPISIYNINTFDIVSNGRVYVNGNIVASEPLDASAVYIIVGCYIKAS